MERKKLEEKKLERKVGMNFSPAFTERVIRYADRKQLINVSDVHLQKQHQRTFPRTLIHTHVTVF